MSTLAHVLGSTLDCADMAAAFVAKPSTIKLLMVNVKLIVIHYC